MIVRIDGSFDALVVVLFLAKLLFFLQTSRMGPRLRVQDRGPVQVGLVCVCHHRGHGAAARRAVATS